MGKQNKQKGRYNLDQGGFTEFIKIDRKEKHILAETVLKKSQTNQDVEEENGCLKDYIFFPAVVFCE